MIITETGHMKYRLYGSEGINDREVQKLKEWGIIK